MKLVTKLLVAGSILTAGTALAPMQAMAQPGVGEPIALGNVYATNDWGDLLITEWSATHFSADYGHENGKIDGDRNGNQIDGYWSQTTSDHACSASRGGTNHYGRMTFTFNARLDAFEGRWGYCDEAPYVTWNGSLTRRGKRESRAANRPVATPAPAAQNGTPQASVYATVGFDKIKPELVLDISGDAVTGTYTATQSEAELDTIYRTGTYGITSGTLEGQFSGNRLTGYWYETAYNAGLQTWCEDERKGTHVYGRFVLTFSADRKSFTGLRTGCDVAPDAVEHVYETWNGTLVRKQAAAPSPSTAPSASTTSTRIPGAKPAGRIANSAARGA